MKKKNYKILFSGLVVLLLIVVLYYSLTGATYKMVSVSKDNFDGYSDTVEIKDQPVKILFFGDAMFDRYVRKLIASSTCEGLFNGVKAEINSADLTIINLEGAITSNTPVAKPNGTDLRFTFATSTATCLSNVGIDAVSLANNHSYNFGEKGIIETKKLLNNAGVEYFGDPFNKSDIRFIKTINGKRIAIVGYHELYYSNLENISAEIVRLKSENLADYVIVFAHWGEEYTYKANSIQKKMAREFVDAGADAVIGAHAHVIQENESYKGVPIYYSLGNFIFDQYFSEEVQKGVGLEIILGDKNQRGLNIKEIPIRITKNGPVIK